MVFISINEFFDLIIMTLGVGFIFMDFFTPPQNTIDPLQQYKSTKKKFDWHGLWIAILITAPAVIFHELAHKFTAMAMGLHATFHAAYTWLGLGIILKLLNTGFIFFVPGYVSTLGATALQHSLIAFAGPALNGILYLTAHMVLKTQKKLSPKAHFIWALTKRINGFLFIFNMIPLPFFDGGHVFRGLWSVM